MSAGANTNSVKAQTLSSPLSDDVEMSTDTSRSDILQEADPEIGAVQLLKMLLSGQYTYLTYMLMSTTCFFFWLMPNCHKIRRLFSITSNQKEVIKRRGGMR